LFFFVFFDDANKYATMKHDIIISICTGTWGQTDFYFYLFFYYFLLVKESGRKMCCSF